MAEEQTTNISCQDFIAGDQVIEHQDARIEHQTVAGMHEQRAQIYRQNVDDIQQQRAVIQRQDVSGLQHQHAMIQHQAVEGLQQQASIQHQTVNQTVHRRINIQQNVTVVLQQPAIQRETPLSIGPSTSQQGGQMRMFDASFKMHNKNDENASKYSSNSSKLWPPMDYSSKNEHKSDKDSDKSSPANSEYSPVLHPSDDDVRVEEGSASCSKNQPTINGFLTFNEESIRHPSKKSTDSSKHSTITEKHLPPMEPSDTVEQIKKGFEKMEKTIAGLPHQCADLIHGRNVDGYSGRSLNPQSDTVVEPSMTQEKHRASTGTDFFIRGKIIYENNVKQTTIYLAHAGNENQIRCLKTIRKSMLNGKPEDEVFSKLKNSNVVHFYQSYYTKIGYIPVLAIVMELCYLSVEDYICNSEGWFEKNREIMEAMDKNREMDCKETHSNIKQLLPITLLEILKQSTNGIRYLHNHDAQICHRDIKPANFMVTCDGSKTLVKVCDFGLSRKLLSLDGESSKYVATAPYGTEAYIPPESLKTNSDNKAIYKKSSDIFSFGIMFYFVLAEEKTPEGKIKRGHPFRGINHHRSRLTSKKSPQLFLEAFDNSLTKEQKITARELIRQMLEFEPKKRCTIEDVYKHPVFWKASKKCRFLVDAHKHIEDQLIKVTESLEGVEINFRRCKDDDLHERLNHFDERLLLDCDKKKSGVKEKFDISLEILPQSVREVKKHIVRSCRNVEEFLTVMRNKASHGNLSTAEQAELFGDKKGDEKWKTFLNCFLKGREQCFLKGREHLLIHLYQVFKDVEELSGYY